MTTKQTLIEMGIDVPSGTQTFGTYVPAKRVGDTIYVSGQLPMKDGKLVAEGIVGDGVTLGDAQAAARQCVVNALVGVEAAGIGMDNITGVTRVGCFVASAPDFTDQPQVANAASELLHEIFGEAGQHVRAAVGVASLPLNAAVEIEFVFEAANPKSQ
ncbi:MAG: RidA family protein [Planctomycetota bacterium]